MTARYRTPPQTGPRILAIPALLMVASLAGLILGLTGDGWRDAAATLLLALPVIAFLRSWLRWS